MNSGDYRGRTRRFNRAAHANARKNPVDVLAGEHELFKGFTVSHGEYRLVASKRHVPSELYRRHPRFLSHSASHSPTWVLPQGTNVSIQATFADDLLGRSIVEDVDYGSGNRPDFTFDAQDRKNFAPLLSSSYRFPIDPSITRDFDTDVGAATDGAYVNKADDGADDGTGTSIFNLLYPYYNAGDRGETESYEDRNKGNFSPNRMVASPVTFGSLPSTSQANAPSTTLLFRPTPPTNSITRKSPERNHSNITTNTVSLPFDNLPIERENLHSTSSSSDEVLLIGRCLTS